jgi:hypothetical protein
MDLSPPSTVTPNSTTDSSEQLKGAFWSSRSSSPSETSKSCISRGSWGTSRSPPASSLTRDTSPARSPPKTDSKLSHASSNDWGTEGSRWWQEGRQRNQSTSPNSISPPSTHETPWSLLPHGSSSYWEGHLQGLTSLPKPPIPWTNGQYMLKYSNIEKTMRNATWSKLKSWSSPCMPTHYKNVLTTASIASKRWGSLTCSTTSKGAPTCPAVPAILCAAADASTSMGTECYSEERVMSPPGHADKLPASGGHCNCAFEWHCLPHDMCFIHDSCLYNGSGSYPPVKPPCDWARYSCNWYVDYAPLSV